MSIFAPLQILSQSILNTYISNGLWPNQNAGFSTEKHRRSWENRSDKSEARYFAFRLLFYCFNNADSRKQENTTANLKIRKCYVLCLLWMRQFASNANNGKT